MSRFPLIPSGTVKTLLKSFDYTTAQRSSTFIVPNGYNFVEIKYLSYINQMPNAPYTIAFDARNDYEEGTLSTWYGSGSGTMRGRRSTYDAASRTISFGQAGRYNSAGWADDDRVCPVKEIWGYN